MPTTVLISQKRKESLSNSKILITVQLETFNSYWHYLFWKNMSSMQLLFFKSQIFIPSPLPQNQFSPQGNKFTIHIGHSQKYM